MNPFLSLALVLCLIVLLIKGLHFLSHTARKNKNIFLGKGRTSVVPDIRLSFTLPIDEKHKVIVLTINNRQKTILLGPNNATILDESIQKSDSIDTLKTENKVLSQI